MTGWQHHDRAFLGDDEIRAMRKLEQQKHEHVLVAGRDDALIVISARLRRNISCTATAE